MDYIVRMIAKDAPIKAMAIQGREMVQRVNLAALGKPFPMFVHCPHGQHDMGVGIVSRRMGVMDGKINNHAF